LLDDPRGCIWRVTFRGDTATTGIAPAAVPGAAVAAAPACNAGPPEGIYPDVTAADDVTKSKAKQGTEC
jgi:hypothetical protein